MKLFINLKSEDLMFDMTYYTPCDLMFADVEGMWTLSNVAVKSGGSITIPCYYGSEFRSAKKYWCEGSSWISCRIVAYASTYGQTTVIDDPYKDVFTVKMYDVYYSGHYWCSAEKFGPDDMNAVYLTVSQRMYLIWQNVTIIDSWYTFLLTRHICCLYTDPGLSVTESKIKGVVHGSVSIQCFYTSAYLYEKKSGVMPKHGNATDRDGLIDSIIQRWRLKMMGEDRSL